MRDMNVDTVVFTNADGELITLKTMREFEPLLTRNKYNVQKDDKLDLIAVMEYGEDSEADCYKIFDHNVAKIVDSEFDLSKIEELEIPN